MLRKVKFL